METIKRDIREILYKNSKQGLNMRVVREGDFDAVIEAICEVVIEPRIQAMSETKHQELLALLDPLVDYMVENKYNYFLVVGKDGTCTRHLRGKFEDVTGMIAGMMESNNCVRDIIVQCAKEVGG